MPLVPTLLFTVCGLATLAYATTILGFGIWVIAPTLMLIVVSASLRLTQLEEIAKAAAMAAGVLAGIFVAVSIVIATVRGLDSIGRSAYLIAGLAVLCVLGILVGRGLPERSRDHRDRG